MTDADTWSKPTANMVIIYDGQCPFCSNFVRLMRLRKAAGSVELIDARSKDTRVAALWKAGYDLNEGMAALYGDHIYYGSDALSLISALSSNDGLVQKSISRLLRSPGRAKLLYPIMRGGRRAVLRLLGRRDLTPNLD